jgi:hypothetical protein
MEASIIRTAQAVLDALPVPTRTNWQDLKDAGQLSTLLGKQGDYMAARQTALDGRVSKALQAMEAAKQAHDDEVKAASAEMELLKKGEADMRRRLAEMQASQRLAEAKAACPNQVEGASVPAMVMAAAGSDPIRKQGTQSLLSWCQASNMPDQLLQVFLSLIDPGLAQAAEEADQAQEDLRKAAEEAAVQEQERLRLEAQRRTVFTMEGGVVQPGTPEGLGRGLV